MEGNAQLARVTVQEFQAKYQSKTGRCSYIFSNLLHSYRGLPLPEQRLPLLCPSDSHSDNLAPQGPMQ